MKYRKKLVVSEAVQWFKNGDHPEDYFPLDVRGCEGRVVRYYRRPDDSGQRPCKHCGFMMHNHGWIDTKEGGHIVCPGDYIITGVQGERYPCKPDIFAATYEPAAMTVTTWCGSRVEIEDAARLRLWLLGWFRLLVRPWRWAQTARIWRDRA